MADAMRGRTRWGSGFMFLRGPAFKKNFCAKQPNDAKRRYVCRKQKTECEELLLVLSAS